MLADRGLEVARGAGGAQLDARGLQDDRGLVVTNEVGGDDNLGKTEGEDALGREGTYRIQRT